MLDSGERRNTIIRKMTSMLNSFEGIDEHEEEASDKMSESNFECDPCADGVSMTFTCNQDCGACQDEQTEESDSTPGMCPEESNVEGEWDVKMITKSEKLKKTIEI